MQRKQFTINTIAQLSDWQIFATRKSAVNGQMSHVKCSQRGFTLVEVLVSIGIFTVLTGVVLSNYRGYNTNALFANASEDIVLALRQAQVYGVGSKGEGSSFTTPFGVHFNGANPNQIIIFADAHPAAVSPDVISGDGKYTPGSDSLIETINWGGAVTLMSLTCGVANCTSGVASASFKRPNPDAVIRDSTDTVQTSLTVTIGNGTKQSIITITNTGQISLQ